MKGGRKVADRWSEEVSRRGYSVGEGLTSGAGGVGEEGRLRFSLWIKRSREEKQSMKDLSAAMQIGTGSWAPFRVSFMALKKKKKSLLFPLLTQTCTSANPPAP